jgi:predicted transcriptional regulator
MYKERSMFEVYLEILNQIQLGNNKEDALLRCTNFSHRLFDEVMGPLVNERLLKRIRKFEGDQTVIVYEISEKGFQFIEFLTLGMAYVEEIDNLRIK